MSSQTYTQLIEEGYCVFPDILPRPLNDSLIAAAETLLHQQAEEQQERFRSQGSMFPTSSHPVFAELIALQSALTAMRSLGFATPTFSDGYLISKPGNSPRLFWHYDWFAWGEPRSYENPPPQIFLMYYLTDTRPENGCLRVIPGSHIRRNALHDLLREPHSAELALAKNPDLPEFSTRPDEIDVPIKAGDLLIGDARLLHATHANNTDERRTVITLWFQPDMSSLPESIQAQMAAKAQRIPEDWPESAKSLVEPLMTTYSGSANPCERQLWRPRLRGD